MIVVDAVHVMHVHCVVVHVVVEREALPQQCCNKGYYSLR